MSGVSGLPDRGMTTQERLGRSVREAIASVRQDIIVLETLEFHHPAFSAPARVARWSAASPMPREFLCRLEDDAPVDAGRLVTFVGMPFEVILPDKSDDSPGEFTFKVAGIGFEIEADLEAAVLQGSMITVTYRNYVKGQEDKGPADVWPGISVESPAIDAATGDVTARGSLFGWTSRTFGYLYTPGKYPALV